MKKNKSASRGILDSLEDSANFSTHSSELDTNKGISEDAIDDLTENSNKSTINNTNKDIIFNTQPSTNINNNNNTNNVTNNDTIQYTNKYTIIMPEKTEPVNERLVANVTKKQKKYIKDMANKKGINESEFVRFMVNYFRKNFEIK